MLSKIIYSAAVVLATAAVILLALFSPLPHTTTHPTPNKAFSFYVQQPHLNGVPAAHRLPKSEALIFHRTLTEGPENTSRVIGKAQGFIIPVESFAHSAFNIIYLTFHGSEKEYSGSVSIEAKDLGGDGREELAVVGGTGEFAFARGLAVLVQLEKRKLSIDASATHHIKLELEFQNKSQLIPG